MGNDIQQIEAPSCHDCGLISLNMKQRVPSKGKPGGILVLGEAPGNDEVIKGEPFIGYSGKLLRQTLQAAGIQLKDVYFTNVCMCRPPDNRTPTPHEVHCCSRRLFSEIEFAQPKRILALGSTATEILLGKKIQACQGVYGEWRSIPVMPAYHPSFILRSPESFRDFSFAIQKLSQEPKRLYPLKADGYPAIPYTVHTSITPAVASLESMKGNVTVDIEWGKKGLLAVGYKDDYGEPEIIPGAVFHSGTCRAFEEMLQRCSIGSQNGSYEYQQFKKYYGIEFPIDFDTMLAHYAIDERSGDDDTGGKGGSYHGLGTIAGLYLDAPDWKGLMQPYREDYGLAPTDVLYRYLALDVSTEHELRNVFEPLVEEENVVSLVKDILFPTVPFLANLELNGVEIDVEYFANQDIIWDKDIKDDVKKLQNIAGMPNLNPGSYLQVGEYLFKKLGLKPVKGKSNKKSKNPSTDKHVIETLLRQHPDQPGLQLIADIRSKRTIHSTFIKGIPKLVDPETGLVHTRFLQHGTPTGRLASRDPNLQNIPARIGSVIRDGFISGEEWDFLNLDYKQLEFRVLGFYSGDRNLIKFIADGRDIHSEVAAEFFGIPLGTETKSQRLDAKTFVFRIPYGGGPEGIAADFGIPLPEAKRRYSVLRGMFPDAFLWIDEMRERVLTDGYVLTHTGRKRRFPLITNANKAEVLRQAGNAPIQGLAHDICCQAARRVALKADPLVNQGVLLVHDSYLMRIKKGHMLEEATWVINEMEKDPFPTPLPFAVDAEFGTRWGSLVKIDRDALSRGLLQIAPLK